MTSLEQKLQQLNLQAMSRQAEQTIAEAAARNMSMAATLEWLADTELEARHGRAIARRLKSSRLQSQPTIDAFHFHPHKSRMQAKNRILRLLDLTFLQQGTNLVLIGNPGVGKTFSPKSSVGKPARRTSACSLALPWICSINYRHRRSIILSCVS
jgi:DNA replication protein DnaC